MNYLHIVGRLGRDAEARHTADGLKVVTLAIATTARRGTTEETIWWKAVLFGNRWDKMLPHLVKGKLIMVGGEISRKPDIYKDKNEQPQVSSIEVRADYVRFVPHGKSEQGEQGGQYQSHQENFSKSSSSGSGLDHEMEEEALPF